MNKTTATIILTWDKHFHNANEWQTKKYVFTVLSYGLEISRQGPSVKFSPSACVYKWCGHSLDGSLTLFGLILTSPHPSFDFGGASAHPGGRNIEKARPQTSTTQCFDPTADPCLPLRWSWRFSFQRNIRISVQIVTYFFLGGKVIHYFLLLNCKHSLPLPFVWNKKVTFAYLHNQQCILLTHQQTFIYFIFFLQTMFSSYYVLHLHYLVRCTSWKIANRTDESLCVSDQRIRLPNSKAWWGGV